MSDKEVRENLKRVFFFLNSLEIKGIANADLVTAAAQTIKALDNEFARREKAFVNRENELADGVEREKAFVSGEKRETEFAKRECEFVSGVNEPDSGKKFASGEEEA